ATQFSDPFVGSGTIWMEALKHPEFTTNASDLSEMSPRLCLDNMRFLHISSEELAQLDARVRSVVQFMEGDGDTTQKTKDRVREAQQRFLQLTNVADLVNMRDVTFTKEFVADMPTSRFERLLFYLVVRTTVR